MKSGGKRGESSAFSIMKYYINENGSCDSETVVFATAEKLRLRDDGQVIYLRRINEKQISVSGVLYEVPLQECVPISNQLYAGFPVIMLSVVAFFGLMYIKKLSEIAINEIN